jgi:glycosyltransferase involved in cell wall biosynthesis
MDKLLAICIPVWNNGDLLKLSLRSVANSIKGLTNETEIIISDNCSEEDILSIVNEVRTEYKLNNIVYKRNRSNIGFANNVLSVVMHSTAEYCWILGSDDFLFHDSVSKVIRILKRNKDLDFLSVGWGKLDLTKHSHISYNDPNAFINLINSKSTHDSRTTGMVSGNVSFDILVNSNVTYLGALMTSIFKRKPWQDYIEATRITVQTNSFYRLEEIYPHAYVFAHAFVGSKSYYFGEDLVLAGSGKRFWYDEKLDNPIIVHIYFRILPQLLSLFLDNGVCKKQISFCRKSLSLIQGSLILENPQKYIVLYKKEKVEYKISLLELLIISLTSFWLQVTFLRGLLVRIISSIKKTFNKKNS